MKDLIIPQPAQEITTKPVSVFEEAISPVPVESKQLCYSPGGFSSYDDPPSRPQTANATNYDSPAFKQVSKDFPAAIHVNKEAFNPE